MTVSISARNAIESELKFQLQAANIPNLDVGRFSEALAKGIARGLEQWERELTKELQRKWKRDIDNASD